MKKAITILTAILLFFLPWQTRLIILPGAINGGYWEYGTVSLYASEILLWAIVVLVIANFFVKRRVLAADNRRERIKLLVVFGALYLYLLFFHQNLVTLNYLRLFIEGLSLFLIIRGIGEPLRLTWFFVCGVVAQATLGIYQFFTQTAFASKWLGMAAHDPSTLGTYVVEAGGGRWLRAYGALPHPNILAGYLAAAILLLVAMPIAGRAGRLIRLAVLPVLIGGMFFTFSRGAWLALVAGLLIFLVKYRAQICKEISVIILAAGCFLFMFWPLVLTRTIVDGRLEVKSSSERTGYYSEAWTLIEKHPWIGVGLGNYTRAVHDEIDLFRPAYAYQPVHNVFVLALTELGAFGILLIAGALFWLRKKMQWGNILYLVPLAAIGIFDHYFWTLYPGIILIFVYAGFIFDKKSLTPASDLV